MKISFARLRELAETDKLDHGIYESIIAQTKTVQGPIFDVAAIGEATIREIAIEAATEHVEIQATPEELTQERNNQEGAARWTWWINTGKGGKRLLPINQNKVVEVLKKLGSLSAAHVDRAVEILDGDGVLQWQQISAPTAPSPAPAPPQPPAPVVRTLPNGEPELRIDATESEMRNASVEQLRDLDARRRNPSRQKFEQVTQGSDNSRQLMAPKHEFPPMPLEVTRKELITCSRGKFENYRQRYGTSAIDARLQGRG
jgi:hypothetical protein